MEDGLARIDRTLAEVFANLPNRPISWVAKFIIQPLGVMRHGPSDDLARECAELLLAPSATRDRLTSGLHLGKPGDAAATLEEAFSLSVLTQVARDKMREAKIADPQTALASGILTSEEAARIAAYQRVVARVIAVDDFTPEDLALHSSHPAGGEEDRTQTTRRLGAN